jgi:hypothetical protein
VGHGFNFRLRIELGGEKPAPDNVVDEVNHILSGIKGDLIFK